jgi:hypothetical protein
MARTNSTKRVVEEPVVPTTPAPVVVEEPVVVKTKKVKTTKTPKELVVVEAPAPIVESTLASAVESSSIALEAPVAESASVDSLGLATEFFTELQDVISKINNLKLKFRTFEKKVSRDLKIAQKKVLKRKSKSGERKPSGFTKPTLISDELAVFLDKPLGTIMARTQVTSELTKYIRTNNLKDVNNGRNINADEKLAKLLNLTAEDKLTYFNLQYYIKHHFPKATAVEPVA